MGGMDALEVGNALYSMYQSKHDLKMFLQENAAHPYLQQRLHQTIRGVSYVTFGVVLVPLVCLSLTPFSWHQFVGFWWTLVSIIVLTSFSIVHVLVRYILMPHPRKFQTKLNSFIQACFCWIFQIIARLIQEPQFLILFSFFLLSATLWKSILSWFCNLSEDALAYYGLFVLMTATSSLVSFVSFEQGLAEDPFVLDPNIALWSCLQRNLVRAVRRAILVFVFTRSFLVLIGEIGVWSLHLPLMYFQLMSLFVENFVLLSTSSAFQIFLFRPNYTSIEEAAFDTENILWETMNCRRHQEETSTIEDLFMIEKRNPKELLQHKQQTNTMRNVELYEQKIYFLKQRMNHAIEKLSKVSGVDLSSESSDLLDDTFKFTNVHLICKFNRHVRKNLFTSFWTCFFEASTGVIDSFSLSLGVLNSISTRRHRIEEKKAIEMEKSLPKLLHFLMDQVSKYPLLLLDQNPHLSHLTIPSDAFESKLQYFFDSKVQFAARFFVMEETKRRIFLRLQLVKASLVAIGELVSISRKEDQQGNVQHTIPAILCSLVTCRQTVDDFIEDASKIRITIGSPNDIYAEEATSLIDLLDKSIYRITNTFYGELENFTFPTNVKEALQAYVNFEV